MKLNSFDTETGFDMMVKFLPVVSEILENADVANVKSLLKNEAKTTDILRAVVPVMLKDHKEKVIQLVALMQGNTAEEVKQQPVTETVETFSEGVKIFADFFPASLRLVANA